MAKAKVGDKVRIINAARGYGSYYTNGAEGVILSVETPDPNSNRCGSDVNFTKGWRAEGQPENGFWVWEEEYEVISNESKTQTKKEKEMGNQIRMKQGVYAVVDTANGEVLAVDTVREDARSSLQRAKNNGVNAKLVKLKAEKWVR